LPQSHRALGEIYYLFGILSVRSVSLWLFTNKNASNVQCEASASIPIREGR